MNVEISDRTLKVLCVDDEKGMCLAIRRTLDEYALNLPDIEGEIRFQTEFALDGKLGLEMIRRNAPQILLLDYKLPDISGLDVLKVLDEGGYDPVTVMITAYASIETAVAATKRGAFDFLPKPFSPDELRAVVRKAASQWLLRDKARVLAEQKRRARFETISVLAHELKAPLNAVEGYLNIIRDRSAGGSPATYARILDRSLYRLRGMRKLIMDLLDLTRMESGSRVRKLQIIDLVFIARQAAESVTADAGKRGISLAVDSPESMEFYADPAEMEIVFNNLISNAVKYNNDGGSVTVTLCDRGEELVVDVADTGIGFSEKEAERLFSEFGRIRNEKTKDILGSGLGLSIVKKNRFSLRWCGKRPKPARRRKRFYGCFSKGR